MEQDSPASAKTQSAKQQAEKIVVLGGGSFGTVIANMLAENGHRAFLWMRNQQRAAEAQQQRENSHYLPGYQLHQNLTITADLAAALSQCQLVFVSVPSKSFREVLQQAAAFIDPDAAVVSTTKGIEAVSFKLMSQIIQDELPSHHLAVISGPNLAKEIAQRQLTGTVVASDQPAVCERVEEVLKNTYFRLYSNNDFYGVELAGVLKNIYAIVAGMAAAMGLGQNTISMIMTRSLAEMSRFAVSCGANPLTFIGLAGVGDLIVTCSSPLSRNYQIGYAIGEGLSLQQAIDKVGQVAEGVNTLKLVKQQAEQQDIYMPLASSLYEILFNNSTIDREVECLMGGASNQDVEFVVSS